MYDVNLDCAKCGAKITQLPFQPSGDRPVYVYGIGHHGSLIALDVAYNGRDKYDSVDEIPKPLSLWKVNLEKI